MPVCLAVATAVVALATQSFTLAWTHSIEKVRWEEDYVVEGPRLRLVEARILGSGAGMEPPADSRLLDGVWHYDPHLPPLAELRLTRSRFAAGYEICYDGRCARLAGLLPAAEDGDVVEVRACAG